MNEPLTARPRKPLSGAARWGLVAGVVTLVLAVDQITKYWALNNLDRGFPEDVFWTLRFNLAFNTGMAFSTGSGAGPIIGLVAIGITVVMVLFARKMESKFQLALIGLIIGGAFGNVIDRIFRSGGSGFMSGAVVDFIDLQWWPIFNVADAAVVVGGIALALASFREEGATEPAGSSESAVPSGPAASDEPTESVEPSGSAESIKPSEPGS